ncbi:hypothetical protein B0O80DRAFT_423589 [Mortierella sp. GBAus27b]|nr:hypothetical protein BGX31_007884 [Mortierella sp. GBA43]KAI8359695.1 hypothetical protein B0O80DRAFT_423589 [Mortierella sp. GBAus27b]
MRLFLVSLLAAVIPAASLARQESFCEENISYRRNPVGRPTYHDLEEVKGWAMFDKSEIKARQYQSGSWQIIGTLEEKLPLGLYIADGLTFSLNEPEDFNGRFFGWIGRGQVNLRWESGATIVGPARVGDFQVSGETRVVGTF